MISRLTPFTDLTKKENLEKISLNENLMPDFIGVLQKMQNFFSDKGLVYANRYDWLFRKYFTCEENPNKFSINFATFKNEREWGYYILQDRKIFINNKIPPEKIEEVLSHEFIHFLILTERPYVEYANYDFRKIFFRENRMNTQYGTFLNEAITEYINRQIYPSSRLYPYHVKMLEFMNRVFNREDTLMAYLRGYIPDDGHKLFSEFKTHANMFHAKWSDGQMTVADIKNSDYMKAQKVLHSIFSDIITNEIEDGKFNGTFDYVQRVYDLTALEPFKTNEFKEILQSAHLTFLKKHLNLDITNKSRKQIFLQKLENIISNYNKLEKNLIISYDIPINYGKINLEIYDDKIGVVFESTTQYFKRDGFNFNKLITFENRDKQGNTVKTDLLINIFNDKIDVALTEPYDKNYEFDCGEKKLKHIQNNVKKDLKKDIEFLESQKNAEMQDNTHLINNQLAFNM